MNDLRVPTGLFFLLVGLILLATSAFAPHYRAPLLEVNVNLISGLLFLIFGGILLWLARRRMA